MVQRLLAKEKALREKIHSLGIDYEFPGYSANAKPSSKRIKFSESDE